MVTLLIQDSCISLPGRPTSFSAASAAGGHSQDREYRGGEGPLGAGSIAHLSWKQLLDGDACTECGRCQAVCPAYAAGNRCRPSA